MVALLTADTVTIVLSHTSGLIGSGEDSMYDKLVVFNILPLLSSIEYSVIGTLSSV